jgi:hypothetical protein
MRDNQHLTRGGPARNLIDAMRGLMRHRAQGEIQLVVELVFDDESKNWCFRVPSLHIVGGAESKDAALEQAVEAVLFALETEEPTPPNVERAYVPVDVRSPKLVFAGR